MSWPYHNGFHTTAFREYNNVHQRPSGSGGFTPQHQSQYGYLPFKPWVGFSAPNALLMRPGDDAAYNMAPPPPPSQQSSANTSNLDARAPEFTPRETRRMRRAKLASGGVKVSHSPPRPPGYLPIPPGFPPPLPPAAVVNSLVAQYSQPLPLRLQPSIAKNNTEAATSKKKPLNQSTIGKDFKLKHNSILIEEPPRPQPSVNYLLSATCEPKPLPQPRPLLVILDLNGTLLHRTQKGGTKFRTRPRVIEFLDYLFSNHHVMIWSSAIPNNVQGMCRKLLTQQQQDKLVACWGRDTLRLSKASYESKVQVYKQLRWIWEDHEIQSANPYHEGKWSQKNTVLIDDSKVKAVSEPHNLIEIEEFEGRKDQMASDVLGQVISYLEFLHGVDNVSAQIRASPFRYDANVAFDWSQVVKSGGD